MAIDLRAHPRPGRYLPEATGDRGLTCNQIVDANGNVVMDDENYYPSIIMHHEDWQLVVDAVNAYPQVAEVLASAKQLGLVTEDEANIENLMRVFHIFIGCAVRLKNFVDRERALRDSITRGGQHTGHSPSISPSVLKELERILGAKG